MLTCLCVWALLAQAQWTLHFVTRFWHWMWSCGCCEGNQVFRYIQIEGLWGQTIGSGECATTIWDDMQSSQEFLHATQICVILAAVIFMHLPQLFVCCCSCCCCCAFCEICHVLCGSIGRRGSGSLVCASNTLWLSRYQ